MSFSVRRVRRRVTGTSLLTGAGSAALSALVVVVVCAVVAAPDDIAERRRDTRLYATSTANEYRSSSVTATVRRSGSDFQQVFIEHEPDTPWHLHAIVRLSTASC